MDDNYLPMGTSAVGKDYVDRVIAGAAPSPEWAEDATETFSFKFFNAINNKDGAVGQWRAVPLPEVVDPTRQLTIYRVELRQAVDTYINLPWLKHPHIDWMAANALIYAEVSSTASAFQPFPPFGVDGINWGTIAWRVLFWLIKWGLWLAVMIAALILGDGSYLPAGIWLVLTALVVIPSSLAKRRKANLLRAMLDAYEATRTSTMSWSALWDQLTKTRDLGAVWDPELYRLVELRKR